MNNRTIQLLLLTFSLVMSISACAENSVVDHVNVDKLSTFPETVKREFQQSLGETWKTYTITEYVDKHDDKLQMLNKVLSYQLPDAVEMQDYKELSFFKTDDNSAIHLGLILVSFPSAEDAQKSRDAILSAQKSQFFENSKILTEFFTVVQEQTILFVYSESFMSDEFKSFKGRYSKP